MAKVQGTFYTGEKLRRGTSPVSPPYLGEDGQPYPVNPPGLGTSIGYLTLSDVDDSTYTDKDWNTPVVDENIGKLKLRPYVRDTGVIAFDGAVYNSPTTVDIGAIKAFIADNETDPLNPTLVYKEYAGATGVSVTTVGTGTSSYAFLKSDGTIHFQNGFPTSDERKSMVFLFKVGHPAGSITAVANEPDFNNSALQQLRDLFQAFNYVNGGVYPYPDAADLSFNTTGGDIVGNGINFVPSLGTIPNDLPVSATVPCSFLYRTQTGAGGGLVSLVDPTQYDVAGTITAVGGGSNRSTLQYLFYAPNAGFLMQYGQNVYDTLIEAIAAVGREELVIYEPLVKNAILIGVFALNRTATDLTDESKARVFKADIFGQLVGSAAGTSVTTLQRAYLNSIIPQIETTIGALTLKNGGAADTDSVVSIQNLAASETFKVTGAGNATANSFVKTGGTSSQYLKADGSVSGISPYDLAQVGAADGDKLTWVAANSRYEPVAGGGGSSNWTVVGSDIYRNSNVAIGRTTIPSNGTGLYTFAVQSKVTGAGGDVEYFLLENNAGVADFIAHNNGLIQVNPTGSAGGFLTFGNILSFSGSRGLVVRPISAGSSIICTDLAGTVEQFAVTDTGTVRCGQRLEVNGGTANFGSCIRGRGNNLASRINLAVERSTGTVDFQVASNGEISFFDGGAMKFGTTTGFKLGLTTSDKLAFWNKTPIIQPTNAITAAAFVTNTSGTVNDSATFGGYTIGQIAAALINVGILA